MRHSIFTTLTQTNEILAQLRVSDVPTLVESDPSRFVTIPSTVDLNASALLAETAAAQGVLRAASPGRILFGTYSSGIKLTRATDNPLTITSTGKITANGYGVAGDGIYANASIGWSITNLGTVSGSNYGIKIAPTSTSLPSTVINGSQTDRSATIQGDVMATSIVNLGQISGFDIGGDLKASLLINRGEVSSTVYCDTIANYGFIQSVSAYNGSIDNHGEIGSIQQVGYQHDFTLLNSGTVDRGVSVGGQYENVTVVNHGKILGGLLSGGRGFLSDFKLSNFGYIQGVHGSNGIYLNLPNGAEVVNGSRTDHTATISGAIGIFSDYSPEPIVVTNYGLITGAVGIALPSGVVINYGTVIGTGGVAVSLGTGSNYFGGVTVGPGAVFNGLVTGGIGDRLALASAASAGTLSGLGTAFVGFGSLSIYPGAHWVIAGANQDVQANLAVGFGSRLSVTGQLQVGDAALNGGTLGVGRNGEVEIGSNGKALGGRIVVDAGNTLSGYGTLFAPTVVYGDVVAKGGTLAFSGTLGGSGTVEISPHAAVDVSGEARTWTLAFLAGAHETLALHTPSEATSKLTGFAVGDTIDLVKTQATSASFAGQVLRVSGSAGGVANLRFSSNYAGSHFVLSSDHHGGSEITLRSG